MTVNELVKLLEGYPPDLRVMVSGYEEESLVVEFKKFRRAEDKYIEGIR